MEIILLARDGAGGMNHETPQNMRRRRECWVLSPFVTRCGLCRNGKCL
jgi:hypothetical protein